MSCLCVQLSTSLLTVCLLLSLDGSDNDGCGGDDDDDDDGDVDDDVDGGEGDDISLRVSNRVVKKVKIQFLSLPLCEAVNIHFTHIL